MVSLYDLQLLVYLYCNRFAATPCLSYLAFLSWPPANAGDANVPITRAAAAKTATSAKVVWFIIFYFFNMM